MSDMYRRSRGRYVAALAATISLLTASAGAGDSSSGEPPTRSTAFPMTVDSCGTPVIVKQRPERVLTSGTDAVDLVVAAGGADRVAARAAEFGQPLRGPSTAVAHVPVLDQASGEQAT